VDIKVTIIMMAVAGIQTIRELVGLYRNTQDDEDTDDSDGS
jgi:hypothetical protein